MHNCNRVPKTYYCNATGRVAGSALPAAACQQQANIGQPPGGLIKCIPMRGVAARGGSSRGRTGPVHGVHSSLGANRNRRPSAKSQGNNAGRWKFCGQRQQYLAPTFVYSLHFESFLEFCVNQFMWEVGGGGGPGGGVIPNYLLMLVPGVGD